jgi:hypothetical protein
VVKMEASRSQQASVLGNQSVSPSLSISSLPLSLSPLSSLLSLCLP